MSYFLSLCSPETYSAFSHSDRSVTGFRIRHQNAAGRVRVGDKLLYYITGLSRWCGVATVASEAYIDESPRYVDVADPFVVRFKVDALTWLAVEMAIPIHESSVWNTLSFTSGHDKRSSRWTGKLRTSLATIDDDDGAILEQLILEQARHGQTYHLDERDTKRLQRLEVNAPEGPVAVFVPDAGDDTEAANVAPTESRESVRVQAQLARIGAEMGMQIWVPRSDRGAVLKEWPLGEPYLLSTLPLNYNDATIQTIEQIDILWLRRRAIVRAFEVEHTTAIYSGILRMADLLALQPNLNIKLHIVAPSERRDKVFRELRRPVFSLLDSGPLSQACTYLSYDSVAEIGAQPHLSHLSDTVLEEYVEEAE